MITFRLTAHMGDTWLCEFFPTREEARAVGQEWLALGRHSDVHRVEVPSDKALFSAALNELWHHPMNLAEGVLGVELVAQIRPRAEI